jgi:hypothetical protein
MDEPDNFSNERISFASLPRATGINPGTGLGVSEQPIYSLRRH